MTFRPGFRPPPMDKRTQAVTGRARTLALPVLPAGTPADEHVSVAGAAELLITSQQSINRSIVNGVLPAYRLGETRRVLVADLATTQTGRAQARQTAEEHRRRGHLADHRANGSCNGPRCSHWVHEGEPPIKRKRPCSPALRRHLETVRVKARVTHAAKRVATLADIEQVKNRIAAEQAADERAE